MRSEFLFRQVTIDSLKSDAAKLAELTERNMAFLEDGVNVPLGKKRSFPLIVSQKLFEGISHGRFIAHVAVERKTGKIVAYAGMAIDKGFSKGSSVFFKHVAKYPNQFYGWEDWLITDRQFQKKGLAARLRSLNERAIRRKFLGKAKRMEIFSNRAKDNISRKKLDEKTGFAQVLGVIGKPAKRKYKIGRGIVARREIRICRR